MRRIFICFVFFALLFTSDAATSQSVSQQAQVILTNSIEQWQDSSAGYVNTTTNYGDTSTALGIGAVSYPSSTVVTVGQTWNTWCCGYTGEAIWPGGSSVTIGLSGVIAFGMQVEPDPYLVDSMTFTLSNGQSITNSVGGEAGAQFFGFVGTGIKSITITDNSGNSFAFGNFYSISSGCQAPSFVPGKVAQATTSGTCITVAGADLVSNTVTLALSASQATTGPATITLNGSNSNYSMSVENGKSLGPGSYDVHLDRPNIPPNIYSSITASWMIGSSPVSDIFTLPNTWAVYGVVRHSQYNTPLESKCAPPQMTAFIASSISSCTFTQTTLSTQFASQSYENGTGSSTNFGLIKPIAITSWSTNCKGVKRPPGSTDYNTFVEVPSITGMCYPTILTPGVSVATADDNCGDSILLVQANNANKAVKSVADDCPDCADTDSYRGTLGHIDNYVSSQACKPHDIPDLGNFWTSDTHGELQ